MKKIWLACMVVALFPIFSHAEEAKENIYEKFNIKPILKTFLQYSLDVKDSAQQRRTMTKWDNAFDITRFYFGFTSDLTKNISANMTADINSKLAAGTTDSDFDIFLKFAYVDFKNFESLPGLTITAGQQPMPWPAQVEKIWGYRVQGQVMSDYERYLDTSDLGIGIKYDLPKKFGDLFLAVINGTGFNGGPENDNYKDIHGRLTIRPLSNKNFVVSGFGSVGFRGARSNERYRFAGLIGYKDDAKFTIAGESLYASDPPWLLGTGGVIGVRHPSYSAALGRNAKALGFSGFGELKFFWFDNSLNKLSVIGRLDYLDPEISTGDNYHTHAIYGFVYTLNKNVKFLVNHDWTNYAGSAGQQGNNTLFAQIEAGF